MNDKAFTDTLSALAEEYAKLRADCTALRGVVCSFMAKLSGVSEESVSELIHAHEQRSRAYVREARSRPAEQSNVAFISVDAQAAELLRLVRKDWDALAPEFGDQAKSPDSHG
jgi:hypothetical protein